MVGIAQLPSLQCYSKIGSLGVATLGIVLVRRRLAGGLEDLGMSLWCGEFVAFWVFGLLGWAEVSIVSERFVDLGAFRLVGENALSFFKLLRFGAES